MTPLGLWCRALCLMFGHCPSSQTGLMLKSNYVRCRRCGELVKAIPFEAP